MNKAKLSGDKQETVRKVAGWTGLVCSSCAGILFILRLIGVQASIEWQSDFLSDTQNQQTWRAPLFSFAPDVFVDVWTPFIFCWLGIGIHFTSMPYRFANLGLGRNFLIYFFFHLAMAFFGGIGYGGDVGIILGSIQFACATILLILFFLADGEPVLKLDAKMDIKALAETDNTKIFAKLTVWLCLIAGVMVIIVGIFRIIVSDAHLVWNYNNAIHDSNKTTWRLPLFTFIPSYFIDAWTPLVMGLITVACHLKVTSQKVKMIHQSHLRHFIYFMALGLFGCIGYSGDLGIIFSAFVFLAALFLLIAIFIARDQLIILELEVGGSFKLSGEGVNVETKV